MDLLLFVSTPLLIVPIITGVQSPLIGMDTESIALFVSAFGGLGHHLPGMIRAYGDRELYERFRYRFLVAPILLLAVCIPLSRYRLDAMLLILAVWGCWHALMQVYGFVRIYDAKVGLVSPLTAYWDWLMCLCWFSCGQIFSNGKMARLLEYWYDSGGPLIPPVAVHAVRWGWLGASLFVTAGFLINYAWQMRTKTPPNPVKLLMLISGIGFWWYAMVFIDNILLGIALFEIFHDVQYLAIVWLYNCRRVNTAPQLGSFMRFVFRRAPGMAWLYVGLVLAYGLIGIAARPLENQALKEALNGLVWASTLLHFYYDGFIWKVRETAIRSGLGLGSQPQTSRLDRPRWGEFGHLLKWSPLVVLLVWLTTAELVGSTLPSNAEEKRAWPILTQFERVQNIAAAVPGDLRAQRRAAITLANLDRQPEAIRLLNDLLARRPEYGEGFRVLGEIYASRGELRQAVHCYRQAIPLLSSKPERTELHHQLGELLVQVRDPEAAAREFRAALELTPTFTPSRRALAVLQRNSP